MINASPVMFHEIDTVDSMRIRLNVAWILQQISFSSDKLFHEYMS